MDKTIVRINENVFEQFERSISQRFDSYCKKILKYTVLDYHKNRKKRLSKEICISSDCLDSMDKVLYEPDCYQEIFYFNILGKEIHISNGVLYSGLCSLADDSRLIILLYYFYGLNDREISQIQHCARRTATYRRHSALRSLQLTMKAEKNNE